MSKPNQDHTDDARDIIASMLTLGHLFEAKPHEDLRDWHRSHLSIAESFALLWQQDHKGGVVGPHGDYTENRFLAAHMAELLLAGRLKLLWDGPEGKKRRLSFMVVNTRPVSVAATTYLLQELYVKQEKRRSKEGKTYAQSVEGFLYYHTGGCAGELIRTLEKETFRGLVERGVLTKEKKQRKWFLSEKTIYPTSDPTPEAMLVQDLRALLKREIPANAKLELLLKFIGKTTQLFTPEEKEEQNPTVKQTREKFLKDPYATLTGVEPVGSAMVLMGTTGKREDLMRARDGKDEIYVENSPFLASEEESLRWKTPVEDAVML